MECADPLVGARKLEAIFGAYFRARGENYQQCSVDDTNEGDSEKNEVPKKKRFYPFAKKDAKYLVNCRRGIADGSASTSVSFTIISSITDNFLANSFQQISLFCLGMANIVDELRLDEMNMNWRYFKWSESAVSVSTKGCDQTSCERAGVRYVVDQPCEGLALVQRYPAI